MTTVKRALSNQRGQTLYILVISIMAMMMVVGLAVDGGLAFYYQSRLDAATQAAADAGTAVLWDEPQPPGPGDPDNASVTERSALDRAVAVASMNGVGNGGTVTVQADALRVPGYAAAVHVRATYKYPVFFIKLLTLQPTITLTSDANGRQPGVP